MHYQDPQSLLFDAIFHGDTCQVKRLISSGIDKNAVLHSPMRWDGATVLSTASFEGHVEIVRYLVEVGTSVNFTDPCLGRNALHWACMGDRVDIARYLLEHGANVNCRDRDYVTPILSAAINKNLDMANLLISYGADVNQVDRLQSSALHYASFHEGDPKVVKTIIRAGCIKNTKSILGKGTPLENIVCQGDEENSLLLLEAGYDMTHDSWLKPLQSREQKTKSNLVAAILDRYSNPSSLKLWCRLKIREQLKGVYLEKKANALPVPPPIKSYILLESF